MADEIFTAISRADALVHAEIEAIRALSDNLKIQSRMLEQQGRAFENMDAKVDDIRERVIRIEEQESKKRLDKHDGEITALRLAQARMQGVFLPIIALGSTLLGAAGAIVAALVTRAF